MVFIYFEDGKIEEKMTLFALPEMGKELISNQCNDIEKAKTLLHASVDKFVPCNG